MEEITIPTHDILVEERTSFERGNVVAGLAPARSPIPHLNCISPPVEDIVTGQTPGMEEELPGQTQAQIPEQPSAPDALVLEEEIEEELIIEDFTIDGICGVY